MGQSLDILTTTCNGGFDEGAQRSGGLVKGRRGGMDDGFEAPDDLKPAPRGFRDEMRQSHEEMRQQRQQMVERAREWQRQIRAEHRQLERDINKIRQEEAKLKREITSMAAKGQTHSVQTLAKQVVSSRRSVARLEKTKCSLNALNLQLTTNIASASTASAMKMSANMMKEMNRVANVPEMQRTIEEMRTEMARAEVADEIMEEFYDQEDEEVEVDEEVQKVYEELYLDKSQLLASAAPTAAASPYAAAPAPAGYVAPQYAGTDPLLQRMEALRT